MSKQKVITLKEAIDIEDMFKNQIPLTVIMKTYGLTYTEMLVGLDQCLLSSLSKSQDELIINHKSAKNIGQRLKYLLSNQSITVIDLHRETGIPVNIIDKIINGSTPLCMANLSVIADHFCISLPSLLGDNSNEKIA